MAGRIITRKGLRAMVPVVGVPREIKAAAKTTEDLASRKGEFVKASSDAAVEHILTENYLKQAADMVISANPFVSEWALAYFPLVADSETTIAADQDLFHKQSAGADGAGIAMIVNSFRKDGEPDTPFILETVGVAVVYDGPVQAVKWLAALVLEFWQNDVKVLEIPVHQAMTMLVIADNAATTPAVPIIELPGTVGGGYEVEGGGFPILKTDIDTKCLVKGLAGVTLPDPGTALAGAVTLTVHFDGEPLD